MYTGEVVSLSEQQLISCDHAKPYDDAVSEPYVRVYCLHHASATECVQGAQFSKVCLI